MVKHEMRVGSVIEIGSVKIRLDHKSGQRISLVIDAPCDVEIKFPEKEGRVKDNQLKTALSAS